MLSRYHGKRVILIVVDGMGWYTLENGLRVKELPTFRYLIKNGIYVKARSVYPSDTKHGHRAIFYGKSEKTIFQILKEKGLKSASISNEKLYEKAFPYGAEIIEVKDLDMDGFVGDDDDIVLTVKKLKDGYSLMFIHLSVDYTSHKYGPYSYQAINDLEDADSQIKEIVRKYPGSILIITADHGMHETLSGGEHGSMHEKDISVPIIIGRV
ncbi:MAG: alkaline phosphatase family protein [Candidatus Hydrothermarchaeota archaeon]